MKIDLGIVRMEMPDGYLPATLLTMGPEDVKGTASAGGPMMPTMSKTSKEVSYRRVLAVSFAPLEVDAVPAEVLLRGITDIQARARGKTVVTEDRAIGAAPGKYVEIRHSAEMTPVYSMALMTFAEKQLRSFVFTMLDEPAVVDECRKHFNAMMASLSAGLAMPADAPAARNKPPAPGPKRTR